MQNRVTYKRDALYLYLASTLTDEQKLSLSPSGIELLIPDPHVRCQFNAVTGGKIWQFPFQRLNAQNLRSNCRLIKFKHLDINFKTLYME